MAIYRQNVPTTPQMGFDESKEGCKSIEFVRWCIVGLVIKAQND